MPGRDSNAQGGGNAVGERPDGLRPRDLQDACLVRRFQAGETEVFAEIYTRYFDHVCSYLRLIFNDGAEIEDTAQEAFVHVLEALPRYELRDRPFRAWLFRVVRNDALMRLRVTRRVEPIEPDELARRLEREQPQGDERATLGWISDDELLMFVERLPLVQRQILVLRFLLDLSHDQIAEILDRMPGDVRMLQSRALRFLRARLSALDVGQQVRRDGASWRLTRQATVLRSRRFSLGGG